MSIHKFLAISSAFLLTTGCAVANYPDKNTDFRTNHTEWPALKNGIKKTSEIEQAIEKILKTMSLEEKIGQMTQPTIMNTTPEDIIQYHIGSVLNGGNDWPDNNKNATVNEWLTLADSYWQASMDTSDGHAAIPVIWGTDAVHGYGNVKGSVLFPHNIGLGAAHDPAMMERIGRATASQVTTTGLDWTFAPTLAVVRDDRWGRTYEGYSEDPEIVFRYGDAMVRGIQGNFDQNHVIATAKHYLGDGGTYQGTDQGNNLSSEHDLINIHAQGYYSALQAGAQTVMASYSSWKGDKMHGNEYLLTQILKEQMNFDGFVVSDWNAIGQIPGCTNFHCPQAINAGIDMVMIAEKKWPDFIANTIKDVQDGTIPMSRIDDAVKRILRVKMRAGLFDKPMPSKRLGAGKTAKLQNQSLRDLAREAVRKSLVLLKNNHHVLPIDKSANILVTGKTADNISNQTGGWSITWQGTGNTNADFPYATSILKGLKDAVSDRGQITFSEDGAKASDAYDVIIAVIGETPYAEGQGDIKPDDTLSFSKHYPQDAALLATLKQNAPDVPVVTVYVGGRPLWMNPEINKSDAFVAAWLPGTEGNGIADVLFGDFDFTGKLSYSWPENECQISNRGDHNHPLFPYGYGLNTSDDQTVGPLSQDSQPTGCGQR
ncbi:Periplasmic beta-glucosidase precursor [Vibrio aerogenes CECT 7868]|uniref:Periplasmic beta-glucosidase n=1 Tax=Vibrio aerogenes CECT 7868 TaxID=1216006 RepID=A0A1M5UD41_9VIBR|nr:glycoside hydrolase family 3 protein [Vibrio aerogenes]SHH60860.1 Periplasmic beta-glucosidase precursor [Vibrio aerogenes CECT 7868]